MWDRLLVDINIATLQGVGLSLGIIDNGAIGIADGNIVRVGKRTELAGYRAKTVDADAISRLQGIPRPALTG